MIGMPAYQQPRLGAYVRSYLFNHNTKRFYSKLVATKCSVRQEIPGFDLEMIQTDPIVIEDDYFCASAGVGLCISGEHDTNLVLEALYNRIFSPEQDASFFTFGMGVDFSFYF